MICIIPAAGYATRLYPLTENFPKPLLEVKGKTILDRLIEDVGDLAKLFVVVSNHKFISHFSSWARDKTNVRIIDDGTVSNETRLGAVRDIKLAADEYLDHEDVLIMAGDNLLDFSLREFINYGRKKNASCVMCHEERRLEALRKTAVIAIDSDDRIVSYEEKPQEPKGHLAVPPFYWYKADDLKLIDEALVQGINADTPGSLAAYISSRRNMYAYLMPGKRYDIGDLKSYEEICRAGWLE